MEVLDEITIEGAGKVLHEVQEAFIQRDVPRILRGFASNIVMRYADFTEMQGLDALGAWIEARFKRQNNYVLKKTLLAVTGDTIACWFEGRWEDAVNGKQMQNRGSEFLTMRDYKIALCDCTANAWEVGGRPTTPIV